jgi:hypothetical protein
MRTARWLATVALAGILLFSSSSVVAPFTLGHGAGTGLRVSAQLPDTPSLSAAGHVVRVEPIGTNRAPTRPVDAAVPGRESGTSLSGPASKGVEYSGPDAIASSVGVQIRVPDDLPATTDQYYVAVSLFDGAESYDQVGLANDNGSWQIYYSAVSSCDTRPDVHWNAFSLTRDAVYRFEISVGAGGDILFAAYAGGSTSVWQQTVHTGATYLDLDSTMACGASTLPDYTESQVVYTAALTNPPYNFDLANATEDGAAETEWLGLPGSVDPSGTVRNGSNVTIYNQPFTLSFVAPGDSVSIETTGLLQYLDVTVAVALVGPATTPIELQNYTMPSGWTFNATPPSSNGSFQSIVKLGIPAGVGPGVYVVGLQAVNSSGLPNRIALVLTILTHLVLTIETSPASGAIDANETATWRPNASGGLPNYTYIWSAIPQNCQVVGSVAVCRFTTPGTYPLEVGVEDALHYFWYQNETYVVRADPHLVGPPAPVSLALGGVLSLSLNLTGGLAPFKIVWQGLPPGCSTVNGTTLACRPSTAGAYAVAVTLVDSTGFQEYFPIRVTVVSPSATPALPWEDVGLAFVGAGLLVMIAACTLLLFRRRKIR